MNKRDEVKLGVMSSISDKYVDEVTESRIRYLKTRGAKGARRRHTVGAKTRIIAAVASLALMITSVFMFILVGLGGKQVPVYEGMTVSSSAPISASAGAGVNEGFTLTHISNTDYSFINKLKPTLRGGVFPELAVDKYYGTSEGEYKYYAKPNEDVYITVHINNPDNFEILSFTLNGVKYTSYMFEDGSDLENLVLKVNVGNATESVSYTIDEIKYVDGDKIKNVKMSGERTVDIGISNGTFAIKSSISLNSSTATSADFRVSVEDKKGELSGKDYKLYAALFDGSKIIASEPLALGTNENVRFFDLKGDRSYECIVVCLFDAFDGKGAYPHIIKSLVISVNPQIFIDDVTVNGGKIDFSLSSYSNIAILSKIELIDSEGAVVSALVGEDMAKLCFAGVGAGKYTVKVSYSYVSGDEVINKTVSSTDIYSILGRMPVKGYVSCDYNASAAYGSAHRGVDFVASGYDMFVRAVAGGKVSAVYENSIVITDALGYKYNYASLGEKRVSIMDIVEVGDIIGTTGTSMSCSDGVPHLHLSVSDPRGNSIDPRIVASALDGEITLPYSEKPVFIEDKGEFITHLATDIKAGEDKSVRSISGGEVVEISEGEGEESYVVIKDIYGYRLCYRGLAEINVEVGAQLRAGYVIGSVAQGADCAGASGEYLHLELITPAGKSADPMSYYSLIN